MLIDSLNFHRKFAFFTFFMPFLHYLFFGIFFNLIDLIYLISNILLIIGGIFILKNSKNVGFLCGAWGFTFSFHFVFFIEELQKGVSLDFFHILFLIVISTISFILTLLMCIPNKEK